MVTSERAKHLINNPDKYELRWAFDCPLAKPPFFTGVRPKNQIFPDGITEQEHSYISALWHMTAKADVSYYDILVLIANEMRGFDDSAVTCQQP